MYELKPSSPRVRAQQQQTLQHVQFNRQLAEQIPQLQDWQQLHGFIQQHAEVLNYLNVIALAGQAAAVYQVGVNLLHAIQHVLWLPVTLPAIA